MADNEFLTGYLSGQGENRNNGMFGGGWEGLLGLIVIASLFGNGNFGFGGGRGGVPCATQADVRAAVDQQTLISKIDEGVYGQANTAFTMNNTIRDGFHGVDNALCTLGYQGAQHASDIIRQLGDCCCETRAAIKDVGIGIERTGWNLSKQIGDCCCDFEKQNMQNRFDAAQSHNGTLLAIDKLGDRIIGYMADRDNQALRDEVQAYRLQASQAKQNQYLIDQLGIPKAVPAYLTCNPYAATYGIANYGGGYGRDCGCVA